MSKSIFYERFGLAQKDLEKYLAAALSAGGDFADLYFEHETTTSLLVDESMVKSATQGISAGCGVRVVSGERTGYAYTDELTPDRILQAARTAALIASAPSKEQVAGFKDPHKRNLYPIATATVDVEAAAKLELLLCADRAARNADSRVFQVRASFVDSLRHILVAASDGTLCTDSQPLARFNVSVIVRDPKDQSNTASGMSGGGGRVGLEHFLQDQPPEHFANQAVRQALIQLDAIEAPAGEMEVVLGPGWPGILLHEAIGHGLEADFNRKKLSAFAGLMNRRVASDKCTVVDNGTIPSRRGSLNVDDEGSPTQ